MTGSLKALLSGSIDYAGLFPPAKLDMKDAVDEYLAATSGDDGWIVENFVVGTKQFADLEEALDQKSGEFEGELRAPCALVTAPIVSAEQAEKVFAKIEDCLDARRARVQSLEIKMPSGKSLRPVLKALRSMGLEDLDLPFYLEFAWDDDLNHSLSEAASVFEAVGFKARTGGVSAEMFPPATSVARFLVNMASLDTPFKFTAGLHEPLRYFDEELQVRRFGFLNVMLAGALAMTHDLNETEIEEVLVEQDSSHIRFEGDDVRVTEHLLTLAEINEFWDSFGGFGSCSIQEPLDGLQRLGYLGA